MTQVARVAAELAALCFRAGVAPHDGSEAAGRAVCAVLDRELDPRPLGTDEPWPCLLNAWLLRRCEGAVTVVTADRVILPHVVVGTLPGVPTGFGRGVKRGREFATLDLAPAVRAAVALFDSRMWVPRKESA